MTPEDSQLGIAEFLELWLCDLGLLIGSRGCAQRAPR